MTRDGGRLRAVLISGAAFAAGFVAVGAGWWALVLGSRPAIGLALTAWPRARPCPRI